MLKIRWDSKKKFALPIKHGHRDSRLRCHRPAPSLDAGPTRVQPRAPPPHQAFTSSRRVAADHSTAGVSIPPALLAGSPPAAPLSDSSGGGRDPLARGRTGPFLGWYLVSNHRSLSWVDGFRPIKPRFFSQSIRC